MREKQLFNEMISILKLFCRFSVNLSPCQRDTSPCIFCVVFISSPLSFWAPHKFMYTQIMHFRIYLLTREFTFLVIACERVLSEKWKREKGGEKTRNHLEIRARPSIPRRNFSLRRGQERISGRRKFGNLLSETRLIPLEFLIKDRCALEKESG